MLSAVSNRNVLETEELRSTAEDFAPWRNAEASLLGHPVI
jgi:hypothetical protein